MANDRMWLVHRPSGKMALLAKHFGAGWIFYTGSRHEPFMAPDLLIEEYGVDNNTDFEIQYESKPHD